MSTTSTSENNFDENDKFYFNDVQTVFKNNARYLLPVFDIDELEKVWLHILEIAFDIENFGMEEEEKLLVVTNTRGNNNAIFKLMLDRGILNFPDICSSFQNENYFCAIGGGKSNNESMNANPISSIFHYIFDDCDVNHQLFTFSMEEIKLRHQIYLKLSHKYMSPKEYICRVLQVLWLPFDDIRGNYGYYIDMVTKKWLTSPIPFDKFSYALELIDNYKLPVKIYKDYNDNVDDIYIRPKKNNNSDDDIDDKDQKDDDKEYDFSTDDEDENENENSCSEESKLQDLNKSILNETKRVNNDNEDKDEDINSAYENFKIEELKEKILLSNLNKDKDVHNNIKSSITTTSFSSKYQNQKLQPI